MDHVSSAVQPPRAAASAFARTAVTALTGIAVTVGVVFAFAPAPPPPAMADPPVGGSSSGGNGPLGPEGCESLGAMPIIGTQFTSIIHLKSSEDCITRPGGGAIRFDYSGTVVDPVDDTSFWTIQVYGKDTAPGCCTGANSRWASIWTRLIAP